ncbi:hypothetical protein [Anaerotruncus rubiinfantis]|uniref:hypothetical protein n=1 Tax=Anaerotruncus rubiinfantis TaxID=1720200 RepID=UPI003D794ABA
MSDSNIWRAMGAKELIEYIASAEGEQHDAVVYDTGYEFDAESPDALRFIAGVAMTKASENGESFLIEMPCDGSVISRFEVPDRNTMKQSYFDRQSRENCEGSVYVPDSKLYCKRVQNALKYRRIHIDDMTDEERKELEDSIQKTKRSDTRYMLLHYYLPTAFAILTLIYIIYIFTK